MGFLVLDEIGFTVRRNGTSTAEAHPYVKTIYLNENVFGFVSPF